MSIRIFSPLFAAFLAVSCLAQGIPSPTVENLNTYCLTPSNASRMANKSVTIPELFEIIKKKGFPLKELINTTNSTSGMWQLSKGLPAGCTTPIVIHSCPRDAVLGRMVHGRTGHGVRCTNAWLKNSIVHGPFITFDYFFDAPDFDFGQGVNIQAFDTIYTQTAAKNPQAPLIVAGTCVGAKIALEYAANHPAWAIKAMILESPFMDVKKVTQNWDDRYLGWVPFLDSSHIQGFFEWYFPNCGVAFSKPYANLEKVSTQIPIFIAHLHNDSFCKDSDMAHIIGALRKSGNTNIYLMAIKDPAISHGRLNNKKEFAQASNAFLAAHNFPHDKQLAAQGKTLLADAKANAQNPNYNAWRIVGSK